MDKWLKSQWGDQLVRVNDIVSVREYKNSYSEGDIFTVSVSLRGVSETVVMGRYTSEDDALIVVDRIGRFIKETNTKLEFQLPSKDFMNNL